MKEIDAQKGIDNWLVTIKDIRYIRCDCESDVLTLIRQEGLKVEMSWPEEEGKVKTWFYAK